MARHFCHRCRTSICKDSECNGLFGLSSGNTARWKEGKGPFSGLKFEGKLKKGTLLCLIVFNYGTDILKMDYDSSMQRICI